MALIAFFWLTTWLTPDTEPLRRLTRRGPPAAAADASAALNGLGLAIVVGCCCSSRRRVCSRARAHPPAPLSECTVCRACCALVGLAADFDSFWWPDFEGADDERVPGEVPTPGSTVEVFRVSYRSSTRGRNWSAAPAHCSAHTCAGAANSGAARCRRVSRRPRSPIPTTRVRLSGRVTTSAGRAFVRPLASQLWYGLNATLGVRRLSRSSRCARRVPGRLRGRPAPRSDELISTRSAALIGNAVANGCRATR